MDTAQQMTDTRAIELAIRSLGHTMEQVLDYLYWLKQDSREDQAEIRDLKDRVREDLFTLSSHLNRR